MVDFAENTCKHVFAHVSHCSDSGGNVFYHSTVSIGGFGGVAEVSYGQLHGRI